MQEERLQTVYHYQSPFVCECVCEREPGRKRERERERERAEKRLFFSMVCCETFLNWHPWQKGKRNFTESESDRQNYFLQELLRIMSLWDNVFVLPMMFVYIMYFVHLCIVEINSIYVHTMMIECYRQQKKIISR